MTDQQVISHFAAAVESIRAETWSAWHLGERVSYPIELNAPDTLDEAVMQAMGRVIHPGTILAIQCSHHGLGKHTLWQFAVKRSGKVGTWRDSTNGGRKVFVGRMEPKLFAQVSLAAPFAPVLRFDALRDGAVGADLQLVTQ